MQGQKLSPWLAVSSRKTKLILKPGPDWCLKEEEEGGRRKGGGGGGGGGMVDLRSV